MAPTSAETRQNISKKLTWCMRDGTLNVGWMKAKNDK
jgi:hypothetical protein